MTSIVEDWQAEAIDLKRQGLDSSAIAEAVGKHAGTVRKVLKRARDEGLLPSDPISDASSNGNGHSAPEPERDPLDEFRAEAGEAVGPMQTRPGEEPAGALDDDDGGGFEIVVNGTAQLGLFDAGGRKPDSASLRLVGGKIGLAHGTAFQKGDTIEFHGTAVVTAVKQQDRRDPKTGQVVGCEQQHSGLILDLTVG